MRIVLLAVAFVAACAGSSTATESPTTSDTSPPPRAPIACGEGLECSADEVCVSQCECCGIPVPREQLRGSNHCEPLSAECRAPGADPSMCPRLVARPCP